MKTIKKVPIEPVYVEFIPDELEEGKLYISEKFRTCSHLCLCGCKNLVVLPLNQRWWELTKLPDGITLAPSIGNYNFPCKSHYIIRKSVAHFV